MRHLLIIFSLVILSLTSCSPVLSTPSVQKNYQISQLLTVSQRQKIGAKIWQNESGGKISGLTHWNVGEEFPSMGIGHFIWYPQGFHGRWTESFPLFLQYAQQRGSKNIPKWILQKRHFPWKNRATFNKDFNGKRLTELRSYLANNVALQTDYIIATSQKSLRKILLSAPSTQRARIHENYKKLSTTTNGTYALIDYVNFKGDGTNPTERYKNQGWGLMWVLMEMKYTSGGQATAQEFASAAKRCLDRRIKNSPPARGETRWKAGWHNRCNTYAQRF